MLFRILKKIKAIGVRRSAIVLHNRLPSFYSIEFLRKLKVFARVSRKIPMFCWLKVSKPTDHLIKKADEYAADRFSLFGSTFDFSEHLMWDHSIWSHADRIVDDLKGDIKVPWELARFQHAPILACAYQQTKDSKYLLALKNQIASFLDAAPFLKGIHWMNPMEVAIRATNWIVAYQAVAKALQEDSPFHDRLVEGLYDHMLFIERNWEIYDGRTNNHYLSNLIGYAYLSRFFNDEHRWKRCWRELQQEFAWQIQDDGSSYEGSTSYHQLVTELFLHGFLLAQQEGETIPEDMKERIQKMLTFGRVTKDLKIGDDDSGSLLHPDIYDVSDLAASLGVATVPAQQEVALYEDFGVALISHKAWHFSLRSLSYYLRQPSAHFHEDSASITLSYDGVAVLVDPGAYVYTGSPEWRDYFRSVAQHSSFAPVDWNQKTGDLFALSIPQVRESFWVGTREIETSHTLYGFQASRRIAWQESEVILTDTNRSMEHPMQWNYTLAPGIELRRITSFQWEIISGGRNILSCNCTIPLEKHEVWVSSGYGRKQRAWALRGIAQSSESVTTIFRR